MEEIFLKANMAYGIFKEFGSDDTTKQGVGKAFSLLGIIVDVIRRGPGKAYYSRLSIKYYRCCCRGKGFNNLNTSITDSVNSFKNLKVNQIPKFIRYILGPFCVLFNTA